MTPAATIARRRVLAALALATAGAAPRARAAAAQKGELVAWPAVTLLDGRRLEPAHWQGRLGVVVFWSTTCPFCRRHNQHV